MIKIRKSEERGHADHGWLKAYHSFSFADYYDPEHMGFRTLRVINEDRVAPSQGFGTHPHRDMEIVTYMLGGELEHKDSMGNGSIIKAGEVQYMSAGTGVLHSEFNPSNKQTGHLLQIWILPNQKGLPPLYDQKHYNREQKINQLKLIVSPTGEDDSIKIRQDAKIYASVLEKGKTLKYSLSKNRFAWIQIAKGSIDLNGNKLSAGDAANLSGEAQLTFNSIEEVEFLLFDLG